MHLEIVLDQQETEDKLIKSFKINKQDLKLIIELEETLNSQLVLWMSLTSLKPDKIIDFCMMKKVDSLQSVFPQLKQTSNFVKSLLKPSDLIKSHTSLLTMQEPSDSHTQILNKEIQSKSIQTKIKSSVGFLTNQDIQPM